MRLRRNRVFWSCSCPSDSFGKSIHTDPHHRYPGCGWIPQGSPGVPRSPGLPGLPFFRDLFKSSFEKVSGRNMTPSWVQLGAKLVQLGRFLEACPTRCQKIKQK